MKKTLKIFLAGAALLTAAAIFLAVKLVPELPGYAWWRVRDLVGLAPKVPPQEDMTRVEFYGFDPATSIKERIKPLPPAFLQHMRDWDKNPAYEGYLPSAAEKKLFMEYFSLLPPVYGRVFRERCVGIYFVKGFMGNGVTSWAVDAADKVHFSFVLNPAGFKATLSETLTERENSCFLRGSGSVAVDAGNKYKGILYALFHEATHAVDYVMGITPFADNTMPERLRPAAPLAADSFRLVWTDYSQPEGLTEADNDLRGRVTFYGLNGGPLLGFDDALYLYHFLAESRFPSVYASLSWAEDFAELVTWHLITKKLGQPYKITVSGSGAAMAYFVKTSGKTSAVLHPMSGSNAAVARAEALLSLLERLAPGEKGLAPVRPGMNE